MTTQVQTCHNATAGVDLETRWQEWKRQFLAGLTPGKQFALAEKLKAERARRPR